MDLLDFFGERCLSSSTPLYTATSAVRRFLRLRILFNFYTSYIAFLDRWTRLSFLEHAMVVTLQAEVAAIPLPNDRHYTAKKRYRPDSLEGTPAGSCNMRPGICRSLRNSDAG